MAQLDKRMRILEEWLRLPESRRRHATDVVAFAYRLLRERPELFRERDQSGLDTVVDWLLPHLSNLGTGWARSSRQSGSGTL